MKSFVLSAAVFSAAVLAAPAELKKRCTELLWDGRVPEGTPLTNFDSYGTSLYNAEWNLGEGTKWSEVLKFPNVEPSYFDKQVGAVPIEVTISDKSIFAPGGDRQTGFRRSELIPNGNSGNDKTVQGTTTFHFSIRENPARPLNYSHEYQLVFHETADYSGHVWRLKAGTNFNTRPVPASNARQLRVENGSGTVLHTTNFAGTAGWHNYAITTNWDGNTIAVYYSRNDEPLKNVVTQRYNNASGKGQVHIGILKLPQAPSSDVVRQGYQPSNIDEGIIYGGIFIENSSTGTVTLGY